MNDLSAEHQAGGAADAKRFLRASAVPVPLVGRWPAWPQLIPPHTAALNLRGSCLPVLHSYLKAPHAHASALRNRSMYAGPFLDAQGHPSGQVQALLDQAMTQGSALLRLADDIDAARLLLRANADGGPLAGLYKQLPDSLRGRVELAYDTGNRPRLRFIEPLLYRAFEPATGWQAVSLRASPDPSRPFSLVSPVLPGPAQVDLAVRFADPRLDALFAARYRPADVIGLAELLEIPSPAHSQFASLFTSQPPERRGGPVAPGTVRARYFGHACVLVETESAAVLTDPVPGYADDGCEHFTLADLPEHIDAVVLTHAHPDHVNIEALIQLRHRADTVLVPESSHGDLADPDLGEMLCALGFRSVRRLSSMAEHQVAHGTTVLALPFAGEHADLDIRCKMVPLLRCAGRTFMFATDTAPAGPELYDQIRAEFGPVDALYVGMECVGAPLSWLYGPLLDARPSRDHDQARRLSGSDAAGADRLARQSGARAAYVYAMGWESWLRHFTGTFYDPGSEQHRQAATFIEMCAARGVPGRLLRDQDEQVWQATSG